MNVQWGTFTRPDGSAYRQIEVCASSSWSLFDRLAATLAKGLQGHWIAKLDGLDQRYWDLVSRSGKITLHLEHYLGISIYPSDGADADPPSHALLEEAHKLLASTTLR